MVADPSEVPSVTGVLKAWESLAIILYLVIVGAGVGPLFTREGPSGEVDLARVGQVVAVVVGAPLMVLGMFRYLGRRPALQDLPEGRNIWTIGFYRVAATVKTLRTEFRTLGCFYLGYAFWESSNTAVVSLTGAYVLEQLGMSAGDFILIALLFVLCAIPGAIASIKIAEKGWLSLKASVAGALVLSSVCLCCVSAFVPVWNSNGDDVASMAWSVRNLISTQVRALNKNGPLRLRDRALPGLRQRLGLPGATEFTGGAHTRWL